MKGLPPGAPLPAQLFQDITGISMSVGKGGVPMGAGMPGMGMGMGMGGGFLMGMGGIMPQEAMGGLPMGMGGIVPQEAIGMGGIGPGAVALPWLPGGN